MKKITKESVDAFMNGYNYKKSARRFDGTYGVVMEVTTNQNGSYLYLHGNLIAIKNSPTTVENPDKILVSLAGWNTNTTRERLNGIPGVSVHTQKGQAYLNGDPIEDDKFYII